MNCLLAGVKKQILGCIYYVVCMKYVHMIVLAFIYTYKVMLLLRCTSHKAYQDAYKINRYSKPLKNTRNEANC